LMKRAALLTALVTLPAAALADSQLERMEAISEEMNEVMMVMMVNEAAANGADPEPLRAAMPDLTWDDAMREAGSCMLDEYTSEIGSDGVDEMLAKMEEFSVEMGEMGANGATMSELGDTSDMLPEGITMQRSAEITQDCGMMQLQMQRMEASGFMDAMIKAAQ
ncbi:MAG: hypothetical protein RIG84_10745, partial [Roseovarius sp.]